MKTRQEILSEFSGYTEEELSEYLTCSVIQPYDCFIAMEEYGKQMYNQAIDDAAKNADWYCTQGCVILGDVFINQQSILKLKK